MKCGGPAALVLLDASHGGEYKDDKTIASDLINPPHLEVTSFLRSLLKH